MQSFGISSKYFRLGAALACLLLLLAAGFRTAPEAARRQLYGCGDGVAETNALLLSCVTTQRGRLPDPATRTLPVFPGCEGVADYEDRFFCGIGRFFEFVEENRRDPQGSKREQVIVAFTIGRVSGRMADITVVKAADPRNAEEALRVVRLLQSRDVRWTPGTVGEKPSCMRLQVGIAFHGAGCGE